MLTAVLLSLLAGLATGLGGLLVLCLRRVDKRTLGFGLGLSSGIMIIIGVRDLFGASVGMGGYYPAVLSFIAGSLFILCLDVLIPHEFMFREHGIGGRRAGLMSAGIIVALGITIHNIPEGMVVGAGYAAFPVLGLTLALAIALHNIPEGMAIAVPMCASGCRRMRVFLISLLSGLAEPLGAIVAVASISFVPGILPGLLGFAGGVMTYLTMDELLPTAEKYGSPHAIGAGLMAGLIFALLIGQLA
jgi:ZIP family zinc transporter